MMLQCSSGCEKSNQSVISHIFSYCCQHCCEEVENKDTENYLALKIKKYRHFKVLFLRKIPNQLKNLKAI